MKIALCGSMKFMDNMSNIKDQLETKGHEVHIPDTDPLGLDWNELKKNGQHETIQKHKYDLIKGHFSKIEASEAILVCNYDKNGIEGYVGGNTLMEIAVAMTREKIIYILNAVSTELSYYEEVHGAKPIILNGDLDKIR